MLTIEEGKRFLGIMPAVTEEGMGAKVVCFFPKIRQSHLAPSCGGHRPNAKRTVGPARNLKRELDPEPGIREPG
jgi:hypothetical protein